MVSDRRGYAYFTFDDDVARSAAESDPQGSSRTFPRERFLTKYSAYRVYSLSASASMPCRFARYGRIDALPKDYGVFDLQSGLTIWICTTFFL